MKFVLGLLFGLALGVAVGLLLAPQPGEATRTQLGEQSVSLTDQIRSRANSVSGDLRAPLRCCNRCRHRRVLDGRTIPLHRTRRRGEGGGRRVVFPSAD